MPELVQSLGIANLGWFVVAGILLNLTPGPDVLYTVSQSAKSGGRAGAVAALGIVAGCFVHIFAAAFGLSALMAASASAFTLLKWLGAAYLAWIGWSMIRSKTAIHLIADGADATRATAQISLKSVFLNGFWTNALNPKVALFFLAFLPQFIRPDAAHKTLAFLLLGLVFNLNSVWVNLGYAWLGATAGAAWRGALGDQPSARWVWLRGRAHWLERAAGALFIAFGLRLALMDNPSR